MEGKRKLQGKSPRVHGMVDAFRYRVCQKQAHIFLTPPPTRRGAPPFFLYFSRNILGNPYLKILDVIKLFVAWSFNFDKFRM